MSPKVLTFGHFQEFVESMNQVADFHPKMAILDICQ